jgi:hypothetical protein
MASKKLTQRVELEIHRLGAEYGYSEAVLQDFARFVLQKAQTTTQKKAALPEFPW